MFLNAPIYEDPARGSSAFALLYFLIIGIGIFIAISAIIAGIVCAFVFSKPKKTPQKSKTPPLLHAEKANNTINLKIFSKDQYNEIIIELNLYDQKGTLIAQHYLTQIKTMPNKEYTINHFLSATEEQYTDSFKYRLYKLN